jgi:hypothetical protein
MRSDGSKPCKERARDSIHFMGGVRGGVATVERRMVGSVRSWLSVRVVEGEYSG